MKLFKPGSRIRLAFSIELIFFFSVFLAFVLTFFLNRSESSTGSVKDLSGIREKYRVFSDILNFTPEKNQENIDISEIKDKFILDYLKLKTAELNLSEKSFGIIDDTLNDFKSSNPFLTKKRDAIDLKNTYLKKRYNDFSEKYNKEISDPEMRMFLIKSYLELKNDAEAFRVFKIVFMEQKIKEIKKYLAVKELNALLKKIGNRFWLKKIDKLIESRHYSEFNSLIRYIKDKELINFALAEIAYSRKLYPRAKILLKKITSDRFDTRKEKLLLKMRIRDNNFKYIEKSLEILTSDPDILGKTLLDIASIFLIKGEVELSIKYFNRLTKTIENTPGENYSEYWKSLWITAWLKIKNGEENEAREYFKTGTRSPVIPYKIAFTYWDGKLNSGERSNIKQYPFTYYYSRYLDDTGERKSLRLNNFVGLLNKKGSKKFYTVIRNIRSLLKFNLVKDALDYTKYVIRSSGMEKEDLNSIKITESLIYLRKGDFYRTFTSFRNNFPNYQSIVLPKFLKAIYVPVLYKKDVEKYGKKFNVDKNIIYALINRESFFRADIISPANAKGLMQLLDGTARLTAKPLKMKLKKRDLYKPDINIKLGTKHFKELLDKYDGKIYLALAAYNAGSHRVARWQKEFGNFEEEYFIEMIPFSETRNYVKKVLRNYYYYKYYYN